MQGFAKILSASAATVALVAGATMLSTTDASAQIPNIEGMIRGAIGHGYYGGGGGRAYRPRSKVHETKRHSKESKEAKEEDKGKSSKEAKEEDKSKQDDGDKQNKQSARANEGGNSNKADDKGPAQSPPPANNNPPKQPVAEDMPSLTPER